MPAYPEYQVLKALPSPSAYRGQKYLSTAEYLRVQSPQTPKYRRLPQVQWNYPGAKGCSRVQTLKILRHRQVLSSTALPNTRRPSGTVEHPLSINRAPRGTAWHTYPSNTRVHLGTHPPTHPRDRTFITPANFSLIATHNTQI